MHDVTTMAVVVLKRTHCRPFHRSGKGDAQCRTENRKRRTVPAMEPNPAALEIALPYRCGPEIRVAGEIPLARAYAPAGSPESSQVGGGDRGGARAALRSLLSPLGE